MANNHPSTTPAKSSEPSHLRLLILTPTSDPQKTPSPFPPFLTQLTGSTPSTDLTTFAGYTSHPTLSLSTKYYQREVNIWCDEIPPATPTTSSPDTATLSDWTAQLLSEPAREVRDVIGAIVLLLGVTPSTDADMSDWTAYVEAIATLRDSVSDESGRDVSVIVMLVDSSTVPADGSGGGGGEALRAALEDECMQKLGIFGVDFVVWRVPGGKGSDVVEADGNVVVEALNEFGERTGFARLREVLEGTDWTVLVGGDGDAAGSVSGEEEDVSMGEKKFDREFQREMLGLKMAMLDGENSALSSMAGEFDVGDLGMRTPLKGLRGLGGDGDGDEQMQVERLSGFMERVVAVREMAAGMEGKERERFAKREVDKIMKELG